MDDGVASWMGRVASQLLPVSSIYGRNYDTAQSSGLVQQISLILGSFLNINIRLGGSRASMAAAEWECMVEVNVSVCGSLFQFTDVH